MSDDEDPFEAFEAPDDDEDPFVDLEDAAADPGESDDGGDTDAGATDEPPFGAGPDDGGDTQPGRLPDDPFDRAETAREGGPPGGPDAGGPPAAAGTDAEAESDAEATDTSGPDPDPTTPTDDPFTSFSDVSADERDDPFDAFESAGVEGVDPDVVWDSLSEAEAGEAVGDDEKVYSEVSKHRFCERCEHFSGPPETRCTFEGAAIVEFLDMETVRLVNCPVVAEQRALEEGGTELD